jgi:hypothetical protein
LGKYTVTDENTKYQQDAKNGINCSFVHITRLFFSRCKDTLNVGTTSLLLMKWEDLGEEEKRMPQRRKNTKKHQEILQTIHAAGDERGQEVN